MITSDLYQRKQDCCGCELCSIVCSKQIIEMKEDEEGFLYPHIKDESSCINCKLCLRVCPEKAPGRQFNTPLKSFGGSVNDTQSVKESSSGGFATAISTAFVRQGGVVYGVRYSEDFRAIEFDRAETVDELSCFRTSKYAQAHKNDIYKSVQMDLNEGCRVLFVGLPCEISALYHFVKKSENLYTISLICHGATSQKVHRQFCDNIKLEVWGDELTYFSMRHKKSGWKPYYLLAKFKNGAEYLREFNRTDYDVAFKYLKRPSCSVCKYKLGNANFGLVADLVLGDYHAVKKNSPEYNSWGVSQATALTKQGEELLALLNGRATLHPISQKIIATTNIALRAPIPQKKYRAQFSSSFCKDGLHKASRQPSVQFEIKKNKMIRDIKRLIVTFRNIVFHR